MESHMTSIDNVGQVVENFFKMNLEGRLGRMCSGPGGQPTRTY